MPLPYDAFAVAASLEGVPSALAAARDGIDVMLRDRGLHRRTPEMTAESLLRGAAASAALEGSGSGLDEIRSGRADPIADAAVRLSAELLSLVPVWRSVPMQALARMHTLAAAADDPGRGRPRDEPALAARVGELARRLTAPTTAPALAVAGLVHAELLTMHPFASGNGLVARGGERLVLVSRGVDPTSLTVPEEGHLAAGRLYTRRLEGYASGEPRGVREWLLHCATAYTQGARAMPSAG